MRGIDRLIFTIHIAGPLVGSVQRCLRCGEVLADYTGAMTLSSDPSHVSGWPELAFVATVSGLIAFKGNSTIIVDHDAREADEVACRPSAVPALRGEGQSTCGGLLQ